MILFCDSGSTKADWALLDGNKIAEFQTDGLNPVHLSEQTLLTKLSGDQRITGHASKIAEVFFFGAGCGSKEGKERMKDTLKKIFPYAALTVENDLMAAALATAGNDKGIIAILGTGSNCCYYDGKNVHVKNFGLGYILGDEASGAWFGKKFLHEFLYNQLPENISSAFSAGYQLDREGIIDAVYRKPNANIFLSSFMPFLIKHKADTWIQELLRKGIHEFFDTNISGFQEAMHLPVHFVGSIASLLETEIRETGTKKNIHVGKILKRPMDGLKVYFASL